MNILFLALDVDLAVQRGDAVHTLELARSLAARGNRVDLVTATSEKACPDLGPGVHHHLRCGARDLAIVRQCVRIAERSRTEVVYERRLSPKIAFGVSRLAGIPFVVEVNGTEDEASMQGRSQGSPLRPVKARLRREMYARSARIVAVSEGLASHVASRVKLERDSMVVIPNGVDPMRFAPMDPAAARAELEMPDARWIVYIGNFVPWQGVETALDAMPRILEKHPDARLALVGDGILRESLRRRAADRGVSRAVLWAGAVPHEAVPSYIAAGELCVAPFTEARNASIGLSPLKIYEYLACARPVVASAIPGVADLLAGSRGGLAVAPDDPDALGDAVQRLLSSPAEARQMGENGRRFVLAQCTWAQTAARVEKVLEEAVRAS